MPLNFIEIPLPSLSHWSRCRLVREWERESVGSRGLRERERERERERDNQLRKCSLGGYPFQRSTLRTCATKLRWRQKSSIGRRFSKETSLTKTSSLSSSSASTVDVLNVRKTFFQVPQTWTEPKTPRLTPTLHRELKIVTPKNADSSREKKIADFQDSKKWIQRKSELFKKGPAAKNLE